MQRKIANKVQMIHHQLTVPRLLVALSAQPWHSTQHQSGHERVQNSYNYSHGRRLDLLSYKSSNKHMAIHINKND